MAYPVGATQDRVRRPPCVSADHGNDEGSGHSAGNASADALCTLVFEDAGTAMNTNAGMATATHVEPEQHRRRRVLATAMAVPALLAALGVITIEAARWRQPASPLFTAPLVYSLADAIAADDVQA